MNKKIFTLLLCVFISGICVSNLKARKHEPKPEAQDTALLEEEKLAAKRAALAEKTKQVLKSKEWMIYVTLRPATEKKPAEIETDAFLFTDRTVSSKNLSAQGYAKNGSNYSLSVADDGASAVWETMQTHENGQDIAFLRGELNLGLKVMQGAIVYKFSKGEGATHPYTTVKPAQEAAPELTAAPVPEAAKETKKQGKKRRGR